MFHRVSSKILSILLFSQIIFIAFLPSNGAAENGFTVYGDIGQIALPVAAVAMVAAKWDKEGALQFAEAFATTEAVAYGLKYSINERRPNGGKYSFPSGHTSAAFAGAAFLQQRYGWDYGVPAYMAATAVGISRITSHEHHWYDVLAGASLGIGTNLIFTRKYKQDTVAVSAVPVKDGAGLIVSYRFE